MHTTPDARIADLTARGFWGDDTLHSLLARQVAQRPDALAVADQPNREQLTGSAPLRLSWAEVDRASDALAAGLLRAGLGADSRLMVQLPNIVELFLCYYAASKLGAILSPVPVQYGSHELSSLATTLRADAYLGIDNFRGEDLADRARAALGEVPVLSLGSDLQVTGADDAALAALEQHRAANPGDANAIITVCWTSGTTGTPKGVPRSHNMWLATARTTAAAGDYREAEVMLNPFPLVNMAAVGGFLFAAAELGCALILHHPLDPALFLHQLQEEQVNFTIAPPALLNQLAKDRNLWDGFNFSALRAFGSGSAPLSPDMIAVIEGDYGKPIVNFYGSNEGISLFSTPDTAAEPDVRAAMFPRFGAPDMPFTGVGHESVVSAVIDPDSGAEITAPNVPGELCFGGATVFDGYLDHDGEGVFADNGLFRTGDLVEICGEPPHYYRIVGRCKDIINRGGMKISPAELDTLLEGYPCLTEAAVAPYPDDKLGEKICACIVPAPDTPAPSLEAICDYLSQRGIAKFKLPERLLVIDALPRNPVGKVVRDTLRQAIAQEHTS